MHHLHVKHEVHSPTYNEWLDIKAPYTSPTMEANDVTMHVLACSPCEDPKYLLLMLIWASLYDPECYNENSSHISKNCSIGLGSLGSQEFVVAILTARRITLVKS